MIKYIALLSFIGVLFSCENKKIAKPNYAELIKGDWVGPNRPQENHTNQTDILLINDTAIRRSISKYALRYKIREDTLVIEDFDNLRKVQLREYKIIKLTNDSLVVVTGRYQEYLFRYAKPQRKNNLTPEAL